MRGDKEMVMKSFWTEDQRTGVGAHILQKHCKYLRKKLEGEIKVLTGGSGEDSPCVPQAIETRSP